MSWMNIARAAKVLALVGFFMPWLLVSCQGQPIATATGWQMAMGEMSAIGDATVAQDADPAWWAILALVLILGGAAATFFLKPPKRAALVLAGAAGAALVLCAVGMNLAISEGRSNAVRPEAGADPAAAQMQSAMAEALRFELRYGYWVTLLGLAIATGAGVLAWQGRELSLSASRAE
ncbi:hypothetical protein [Brevundimonas sp.]|uniref:hypothetical protein n=1 Tax=Brevundimonas sp. TaxID=1871086 RepID=UPI0025D4F198|nr:hypothetical protein [Brevundimonas sp.]